MRRRRDDENGFRPRTNRGRGVGSTLAKIFKT